MRRTAIERRTEISQAQVRVELAHIAFFDPRRLFDVETGELMDIQKLPPAVAAAVSSVEITHNAEGERVTKVRLVSKIEALDKLCRHLRMYAEPAAPVNNNTFINVDLRGEWSEIVNGRSRELPAPGSTTDPMAEQP